jgi:crossover junction endodeoxyribonuclease RuvC
VKIIAVDVGAQGAVALCDPTGLIAVHDMPVIEEVFGKTKRKRVDAGLLAELVRSLGQIDYAVIEKVGAMSGQGVTSMWTFGRAAGVVEGVLAGLQIPVRFVTPQQWKKAAGLKAKASKDESRAMAVKLFPQHASKFARKRDDGRGEASILAWLGPKL